MTLFKKMTFSGMSIYLFATLVFIPTACKAEVNYISGYSGTINQQPAPNQPLTGRINCIATEDTLCNAEIGEVIDFQYTATNAGTLTINFGQTSSSMVFFRHYYQNGRFTGANGYCQTGQPAAGEIFWNYGDIATKGNSTQTIPLIKGESVCFYIGWPQYGTDENNNPTFNAQPIVFSYTATIPTQKQVPASPIWSQLLLAFGCAAMFHRYRIYSRKQF